MTSKVVVRHLDYMCLAGSPREPNSEYEMGRKVREVG